MGEGMKSVLIAVGCAAALQAMKMLFGYGPALVVATAALSFCIGALWGAGNVKESTND